MCPRHPACMLSACLLAAFWLGLAAAAEVQHHQGVHVTEAAAADGALKAADGPKPPKFPEQHVIEWTVTMPHFYLTQPKPVSFHVKAYYDGPNHRRKLDIKEGLDTWLRIEETMYTIYPRLTEYDCDIYEEGPVRRSRQLMEAGQQQVHQQQDGAGEPDQRLRASWGFHVLPDLSFWDFGGYTELNGQEVQVWQYQNREGDKTSQYTFYVTSDGVPVQFNELGINYITDSHFDEYVYVFHNYSPTLPENADDIFALPAICQKRLAERRARQASVLSKLKEEEAREDAERLADEARQDAKEAAGDARAEEEEGQGEGGMGPHPSVHLHEALLPQAHAPGHKRAYCMFAHAHGRVHEDGEEFETRLQHFTQTVDMIKAHNADPSKSYKMRVNKFADWSNQEFYQTMLPKKIRKQQQELNGRVAKPNAYKPLGVIESSANKKSLPRSVDWRGTGADPGAKDQGLCGSCYAYSATAAMEGAWYVFTGQRRAFSEQQIIDCAWDYGTSGCNGGDYQPVFNYVAENGGIALEQDYVYESNNGWCRAANHTLVGHFEGYLQVESRDEAAVMEAVWKFGPLGVAVSAEFDSFRYYSEGVYDEPNCAWRSRDLDHAVALFGYGSQDGKDYWLVRNSWAKYYGDDGYIKIVRGKHDCGISTDAVAAVVPEELHVPGAQDKAMKIAAKW